MNENIKNALIKIDFVSKYAELYAKHSNDKCLENADAKEVLEIISKYGYKVKYIKTGNFYQISETVLNKFQTGLNLSLKYGFVEVILRVVDNGVEVGEPWGYLCQQLNEGNVIKKSRFTDYKELDDIIKEIFIIYENFKKELLS